MVALPDNPYVEMGAGGPGGWVDHEVGRLRNMDDMLSSATYSDLNAVTDSVAAVHRQRRPLSLLDIGAGTGMTTERFAEWRDMNYVALDANADLLEARPPTSTKIHARSEDIPVPDRSFDITYSRAVTAWNPNPRDAIAEQLRVTAVRGAAVFTEFDWGVVEIDRNSKVFEAAMLAKAIMVGALSMAGFKPEYGIQLGADIDEVIDPPRWHRRKFKRYERVHEFPVADHKELLLETAENVYKQLQASKKGAALLAPRLLSSMMRIRQAENLHLRLPNLVTQVVRRVR